MRVIIKARHMSLTPALKDHAEEKLGHSISRIVEKPAAAIEVELTDLGHIPDQASKECRVSLFIPKTRPINITEVSDDMYKAIDLARDRLLTQISREQGRRRHSAKNRKDAERMRQRSAARSLSGAREAWEIELEQYELSNTTS